MVNMAVIHVRTLGKYILALTTVAILAVIFFRFLPKKEKIQSFQVQEMPSMLACLDETVPAMHQVNHEEEEASAFHVTEAHLQKRMLQEEYAILHTTEMETITKPIEEPEQKEEEKQLEQGEVRTDVATEEQPSSVKNTYNTEMRGVKVRNESKYEITEDMLNQDEVFRMGKVLIFHTHTCESYTPTDAFSYTHNGNFRTTDRAFSVARVGDELQKNLEQYGISVIHDTTYHDYPNYTGSYGRSMQTVESILKGNADIDIVFDLHRDAIGDTSYAPKVKIGEEMAAQVMFVMGSDGGGLEHPNWMKNLTFAMQVQEKANEIYPGLMKPIILRNSRYNQNLTKGACIIEVGATGNTMEECLVSMKYFSKILSMLKKD